MGKRRIFTKEFKEEAIALAGRTDKSQTEIAEDLGINGNMLCRWKREAEAGLQGGKLKAFPHLTIKIPNLAK